MKLETLSAILRSLLLYVYEAFLITQLLSYSDETLLPDVQTTQLQTLLRSFHFAGSNYYTTKPMIQIITLMVKKYDHIIGISGNTSHTLIYKALTDDTFKVIYFSSAQVSDNLDNQSLNLDLPDWDRREDRDYHSKMGSKDSTKIKGIRCFRISLRVPFGSKYLSTIAAIQVGKELTLVNRMPFRTCKEQTWVFMFVLGRTCVKKALYLYHIVFIIHTLDILRLRLC